MAINRDGDIKVAGWGGAHHDTVLTSDQPVVLGHTSRAESDRRFGGAIYLVFETLKRLQSELTNFDFALALVFPEGDDTVSRLVRENLKQRGIIGFPMLVPGQPTASYTAFHDVYGKVVAALCGSIYDKVTVQMVSQHVAKLKQADTWVFASEFPEEVNVYLAMAAVESGIDVYVVISSLATVSNITALLGKVCKAKAVFGNKAELQQLAGQFDDTDEGFRQTLEVIASWGTEVVFATRGEKGVMVYDSKADKHYQFPAHKIAELKGSHGAGATFAGVVMNYLQQGKDIEYATKAGLIAAALRVEGKEKEITDKLLTQMMLGEQKKVKAKQISSFLNKFVPHH